MLGTASSETSESVRARQLKGVLHAGGHEIVSGYGAGITALDLALKYRLSPPGNTSSYVDPGSINKRVILYDASGVTYSNMS